MLGLAAPQHCPRSSAPDHIGDAPGAGVISFGVILPLSFRTVNQQCGPPDPYSLASLEGLVWVITNDRQILAPTGMKIGGYMLFHILRVSSNLHVVIQ